jgi:hypothetical protein
MVRISGTCLVGLSEGTGVQIKGLIKDAEREGDKSRMFENKMLKRI